MAMFSPTRIAAALVVCLATMAGADPRLGFDDAGLVVEAGERRLARAALVGVTLTLADPTGLAATVTIAGVTPDPWDPDRDLYDLRDATGANVCPPGPHGLRLALFVPGRTDAAGGYDADAASLSLSCTLGAVAKCVRFGYAPWTRLPDGTPMADHFRACLRMVRADYLGDGKAHTEDGTLINLWDAHGIQTRADAPELSFEAAWGPEGAVCVARVRKPDLARLEDLRGAMPVGDACTPESAPHALLFNDSRARGKAR